MFSFPLQLYTQVQGPWAPEAGEGVPGAVSATDAFSAVSTSSLLQIPPLYSLEPWALSQRSHGALFDIPDLWKSLEEGVGTESKQED